MNFKDFVLRESLQDLHTPTNQYNQLIARTLYGDQKAVNQIEEPKGDYSGLKSFTVAPQDMVYFKKLFPVAPPVKADSGDLDDAVGSKGVGNGEVALYWLLSKNFTVQDIREDDNPDLLLDGQIGIEVKSYAKKPYGLGRFGKQSENRKLLSIAFGLKTLFSNLLGDTPSAKRAPSLDTFNAEDLKQAFQVVKILNDNVELRTIAATFPPIQGIYDQINTLLSGLNLSQENFTAEQGAAAMLKAFLVTKLEKKPRFGGYVVNILGNGAVKFYRVDKDHIDNLAANDPDAILKGVRANGATLLVDFDTILRPQ